MFYKWRVCLLVKEPLHTYVCMSIVYSMTCSSNARKIADESLLKMSSTELLKAKFLSLLVNILLKVETCFVHSCLLLFKPLLSIFANRAQKNSLQIDNPLILSQLTISIESLSRPSTSTGTLIYNANKSYKNTINSNYQSCLLLFVQLCVNISPI